MAVKKRGFYSPWGYMEENDYQSSETQFEVELNELFASASYNKDDKKIHFYNNDGKDLSGSSIDTTQFAGGSVIKDATYDPVTKILTIEFENGDKVEINFAELVDETEFGDGLQVVDSIVSILIDESGEPYLSVGENGLKIVGINQAIADALADEKARAEQAEAELQAAIEAEGQRAEDAEAALDAKVDQEIADREADVDAEETRAISAETELGNALDLLNQKLGYKDNETLQKNGEHEVAFGSYNISNTSEYASGRTIFSVGNGTSDNERSNALEIRENGDIYMWIENDYMQINRLLAMLAHEVYDDDNNTNG